MYLSEFLNEAFENEWTMESVKLKDGKVLTSLQSEDRSMEITFDQLTFDKEAHVEIYRINKYYDEVGMVKIGEVKADYLQFLKNLLEVVPER